ncbi:MAG TPA: hypothetical protein VFV99_08035 [Kofleriaceae bacterium]|nr:hypothetical protein [Kofleriaceae bacterium]
MKIIISVLLAASLMACGGKAKKTTTPDNKTGTTEMKPDGTGGTTYGGAQTTPPATPASGTDPCAGQ